MSVELLDVTGKTVFSKAHFAVTSKQEDCDHPLKPVVSIFKSHCRYRHGSGSS